MSWLHCPSGGSRDDGDRERPQQETISWFHFAPDPLRSYAYQADLQGLAAEKRRYQKLEQAVGSRQLHSRYPKSPVDDAHAATLASR